MQKAYKNKQSLAKALRRRSNQNYIFDEEQINKGTADSAWFQHSRELCGANSGS